jgi:(5-formylfuran-3-yl)methyl phosphate synthase
VAKLLVSVRSAAEARAAVAGGAEIVDVKEPRLGSLGRAAYSVWRHVRAAVPDNMPVSVALGELDDWLAGGERTTVPAIAWSGISFQKLGLAGAPNDWRERWHKLRQDLGAGVDFPPHWVAVVYIDWQAARAPTPGDVISACASAAECRGVLFDTWDKSHGSVCFLSLKRWIEQVREIGRFVAFAGGLNESTIPEIAVFEPDIVAVRGAACHSGDRLAAIDADRVALLARAVRELGSVIPHPSP